MSKTILVAEDDPGFVEFLSKGLKQEKSIYTLIHCTSLKSSINAIQKQHPEIVLLNLNLIDSKQLNTLESIQKVARETPIIIVTNKNVTSQALEALSLGAEDYVAKQNLTPSAVVRILNYAIERKKLRNTLEKKNRDLYELNESLNRFVGIVSHDLRNPIGAITNLTELFEKNPEAMPIEEIMGQIRESSEGALALIHELLDLAALQVGSIQIELRHESILDLFEIAINHNKHKAYHKSIQLYHTLLTDFKVYCDGHRIIQVLDNLVSNAIKFTAVNGHVSLNANKLSSGIQISVRDTGVGIPKEDLTKLFKKEEKLSTLGTDGEKGTGFGLPLSQEIIHHHKSEIVVETIQKVGTVFSFLLTDK